MSRWQNFAIWHGRLPHWRADDVTYYITFRHRRPLSNVESGGLLGQLMRPEGKQWNVLIVCVLPEQTEMMFTVGLDREGRPVEFAKPLEAAKRKAEKKFETPAFHAESYDRIVRDETELEERFLAILDSPVTAELVEAADDYPFLWVSAAPE